MSKLAWPPTPAMCTASCCCAWDPPGPEEEARCWEANCYSILGLYRDNRKENGNHDSIFGGTHDLKVPLEPDLVLVWPLISMQTCTNPDRPQNL